MKSIQEDSKTFKLISGNEGKLLTYQMNIKQLKGIYGNSIEFSLVPQRYCVNSYITAILIAFKGVQATQMRLRKFKTLQVNFRKF